MKYYKAIVYLRTGHVVKYRFPISNPLRFLDVARSRGAFKVFFYLLGTRKDSAGIYCGYWSEKNGLNPRFSHVLTR